MRKSTVSIPVIVRGHEFKSMAACARYFKVAYTTVVYHFDNGTLDQLGLSNRPKNNCHPITIDGVQYESRTAAYRALGLDHQEFYKLMRDGKLPR